MALLVTGSLTVTIEALGNGNFFICPEFSSFCIKGETGFGGTPVVIAGRAWGRKKPFLGGRWRH